ncbi:MAG: hypothetical protein HKN34_07720, partial [Gammaproteobacteria bacterium]|nr:hypothetical protein [Gammaproteobacteria bacterium]
MSNLIPLLTLVLLSLLVTSCDENDDIVSSNAEADLQQELSAYIRADLIPHIEILQKQNSAALERLGMELFFSKSLSGNFDVACASCHHPLLAGGDRLSLPVGESAHNPDLLGPGRWHDWRASMDHKADGAPNVARHSPTTFNSALYKRALFADGRVFLETPGDSFATQPGIRSPDSRFAQSDANAGTSLLATQTRFPVTSNEEMRGFTFAPGMSNDEVRLRIVQRLNGQSAELDHNRWLDHFRLGFNAPTATTDALINFNNIQQALAAYQNSQILVDNSWYRYLGGDTNALSEQQKRGALLFFKTAEDGGANCIACHQPPVFTDEKYHNIAMIQFGRGKRAGHEDFGRRGVTQREQDRYGFRTPSLLNIEHTAPYGHTGAYLDLHSIIRHHLDPTAAIDNFDFAFRENPQLKHVASLYDNARKLSRDALKALKVNQQKNTSLLAEGIALSDTDISDLVAFLTALTDPCVASVDCLQQWIPSGDEPDPDNMRLIAEFAESASAPPENLRHVPDPGLKISALAPQTGKLPPEIDLSCNTDIPVTARSPDDQPVSSNFQFIDSTKAAGIDATHFIEPEIYDIKSMQRLGFSGGAAAGDIDGDCFNDIYYVTGSKTPDALYINNTDGTFTNQAESWNINQRELSNGASFVDIDGDGDLDLFTGNITHPGLSPITRNNANAALLTSTSYRNEQQKKFSLWPQLSIQATVATWSFAFADYDTDGDLDVLSSHWQFSPAQTQHLWRNENGAALTAVNDESGLNNIHGNRDLSFTGIFSDVNSDG